MLFVFSPFIHDEFTLARVPGLEEVLGGVDVGEDGDEGDDAAEDPDPHDQGDHHVPAECWWPLVLETKAIRRFAKVIIVSYSRPSPMIGLVGAFSMITNLRMDLRFTL